jgi:hypothetical protein
MTINLLGRGRAALPTVPGLSSDVPSFPQFLACMSTLDRLFAHQARIEAEGSDLDQDEDALTLMRVAAQLASLVEMADWIHAHANPSHAELAFRRDLDKSIEKVLAAADEFLVQHT